MNRNNKIGLAILLTPFVGAFAGAVLFGNPEQNSASANAVTPAQQEFVAVTTQEPVLRPKPRPTPEAGAQADSGSSWLLQLTGGEKAPDYKRDAQLSCSNWERAYRASLEQELGVAIEAPWGRLDLRASDLVVRYDQGWVLPSGQLVGFSCAIMAEEGLPTRLRVDGELVLDTWEE